MTMPGDLTTYRAEWRKANHHIPCPCAYCLFWKNEIGESCLCKKCQAERANGDKSLAGTLHDPLEGGCKCSFCDACRTPCHHGDCICTVCKPARTLPDAERVDQVHRKSLAVLAKRRATRRDQMKKIKADADAKKKLWDADKKRKEREAAAAARAAERVAGREHPKPDYGGIKSKLGINFRSKKKRPYEKKPGRWGKLGKDGETWIDDQGRVQGRGKVDVSNVKGKLKLGFSLDPDAIEFESKAHKLETKDVMSRRKSQIPSRLFDHDPKAKKRYLKKFQKKYDKRHKVKKPKEEGAEQTPEK